MDVDKLVLVAVSEIGRILTVVLPNKVTGTIQCQQQVTAKFWHVIKFVTIDFPDANGNHHDRILVLRESKLAFIPKIRNLLKETNSTFREIKKGFILVTTIVIVVGCPCCSWWLVTFVNEIFARTLTAIL